MRLLLVAVAMATLAACDQAAVTVPQTADIQTSSRSADPWAGVESAMGLTAAPRTATTSTAPPISELIARLEAKAAANPDDRGHWTLLAQSYAHLGRADDAARAAERAIALGADESLLKGQVARAGSDARW